jgi:CSLREA domain-containing protein
MRRVTALTTIFFALAGAASAQATTFAVNTTADTNDAQGCLTLPTCSLREAIDRADTTAGDDTVTVPAGRYVLTLGELSAAPISPWREAARAPRSSTATAPAASFRWVTAPTPSAT